MNRVSESIPMPYVHQPCQAMLGVQAMDTFRHKKALWGQMQMNAIKCHLAISGGLVTFFDYCHHSIKKNIVDNYLLLINDQRKFRGRNFRVTDF